MSPATPRQITGRRIVCDHCRRRRIRCDGQFPCNQCATASLFCKRDHVPKRRGPKRGSGRVINELRAQDGSEVGREPNRSHSTDCSQSTGSGSIDQWISNNAEASTSPPSSSQPRWQSKISDLSLTLSDEPSSIFTTDQFRPTSLCYFYLIPTCLDLFMEHIYPIMPLIYMPNLRESINRPLEPSEKNLLYSLCALTSTHMSGKNIKAPGPPSWEIAGRFFLDECILVRQSYDFVEDRTLSAVISSYFVSSAFFELNQSRKAWYYLREALTIGQDLGLHNENTYLELDPSEALCRRRTFWILYVTERSFAILRHKPLTLSKTPEFPSTIHEYENPEIHTGFMRLVESYHLLDYSFVESWNEASDAPASTLTYTALQQELSRPNRLQVSLTDIQKADILVTQQWLRLIVWQSSMRQGLLSSSAEHESMTFRYPLKIAQSLLSVIRSLPTTSIEVHGMGIFEKIFEIGNTMLDVMQACGQQIPSRSDCRSLTQDPFHIFVRTLSQTPNSQKQYANLLLAKAAEKPEIQRFSQTLTPTLGGSEPGNGIPAIGSGVFAYGGSVPPTAAARPWMGSIVGEINDSDDGTSDKIFKIKDTGGQNARHMTDNAAIWVTDVNDVITAPAPAVAPEEWMGTTIL